MRSPRRGKAHGEGETPEATRGTFAATPLTVSRKQMFIPVHAKPGGFTPRIAPASRLGFASGDMRPFQHPTGNSRVAWLLLDSEVFKGLKSRKTL